MQSEVNNQLTKIFQGLKLLTSEKKLKFEPSILDYLILYH